MKIRCEISLCSFPGLWVAFCRSTERMSSPSPGEPDGALSSQAAIHLGIYCFKGSFNGDETVVE